MTPTNRYTALDVFRGLTICLMILVNAPGNHNAVYAPLEHADWHGFTAADLVFPSFLFAVGNALCFAVKKWNSMTQAQVLTKIFKRTVLLFILGFLLYWFPFVHKGPDGWILKPFSDTRVFGVLQRIALCYCIASLLVYYAKPKGAFIAAVFLLIAYQIILLVFGIPGRQYSMDGNAAIRIDLWLLGPNHMNHAEVIPWEPEGLLGTLPAVANVIAGYLVGRYIQLAGKTLAMLGRLVLTGCGVTALALVWSSWFPLNKNLWTSSFALLTIGLDCIILAIIIYIIDFLHNRRGVYFFEVFGRNALFIFLLAEGVAILLRGTHVYGKIYDRLFRHAGLYLGSLLFAICFMLACWLAGWYLDKRKIYIRV